MNYRKNCWKLVIFCFYLFWSSNLVSDLNDHCSIFLLLAWLRLFDTSWLLTCCLLVWFLWRKKWLLGIGIGTIFRKSVTSLMLLFWLTKTWLKLIEANIKKLVFLKKKNLDDETIDLIDEEDIDRVNS